MSPRRIVTEVSPDGVSRVASIGPILARRATGGGGLIEEAWFSPSLAGTASTAQPDSYVPAFAPPAGSSSCRIVHIPPDSVRWADPAAASDVARTIGAGRPAHWIDRHPGMHVTSTIDYAILLKGSVSLVMEEGEIALQPNDVIVQQATAHAWKNTGDDTAVLFVVMLGIDDNAAGNREDRRDG